jgi:hypothetical protein
MKINPDSAIVAYCAPGLKEYVATTLGDGEEIREIIEAPWMINRTDVILATDPGWYTKPHNPGDRV